MPNLINNPHDAFMKAMLSNIEFMEEFLPGALLGRLDLSTLKTEKADFVTPQLQEYFNDVIFNVALKGGGGQKDCLVSILIEHKSFVDKYAPFQILLYLAEGYRVQMERNEPLRPIVPLLYYHGEDTWNLRPLPAFFDASYGDILDYVPRFETIFADLKDMSDAEIERVAYIWLRAALYTQKYSRDPKELARRFLRIFQSASQLSKENFLTIILVYYFSLVTIPKEQINKLIRTMPTEVKQQFVSTYDMLIQEGFDQGIEKGIEKEKMEVVFRGLKKGLTVQMLSELTGLSEKEVKAIIAGHKKKEK